MTKAAIACACGQVQATLDIQAAKGECLVCYCADCRRFAHAHAHSDEVLDDAGGTTLYHARAGALRIVSGKDWLRAVHMTDKPTLRWVAGCCDMPLWSTHATGRVPYLSIVASAFLPEARDAIGSPVCSVWTSSATGQPHAPERRMPIAIARIAKRVAADTLSGGRRASPLFDPKTFAPIVEPERMEGR